MLKIVELGGKDHLKLKLSVKLLSELIHLGLKGITEFLQLEDLLHAPLIPYVVLLSLEKHLLALGLHILEQPLVFLLELLSLRFKQALYVGKVSSLFVQLTFHLLILAFHVDVLLFHLVNDG
jgi:hypothetical protein